MWVAYEIIWDYLNDKAVKLAIKVNTCTIRQVANADAPTNGTSGTNNNTGNNHGSTIGITISFNTTPRESGGEGRIATVVGGEGHSVLAATSADELTAGITVNAGAESQPSSTTPTGKYIYKLICTFLWLYFFYPCIACNNEFSNTCAYCQLLKVRILCRWNDGARNKVLARLITSEEEFLAF